MMFWVIIVIGIFAILLFAQWWLRKVPSPVTSPGKSPPCSKSTSDQSSNSATPSREHAIDAHSFYCASCGYIGKGRPVMLGKRVKCKHCGRSGNVEVDGDTYVVKNETVAEVRKPSNRSNTKPSKTLQPDPKLDLKSVAPALRCASCGNIGKGRPVMLGKRVKCKHCGREGNVEVDGDTYVVKNESVADVRKPSNRSKTKPSKNLQPAPKIDKRPPATNIAPQQPRKIVSRCNPIQDFIKKRQISQVIHFTRLDNLPGIIKDGLVPRMVLSQTKSAFVRNDDVRIDGASNASCLSLSWPNYQMFYKYRVQNPSVRWAVLSIDPKVLWEFPCVFCFQNAASFQVREIQLNQRKGVNALRTLFEDHKDFPSRFEAEIPDYFPTHPQAEVLVFDIVPTSHIKEILVESEVIQSLVPIIRGSPTIRISTEMFHPRMDWRVWKNGGR